MLIKSSEGASVREGAPDIADTLHKHMLRDVEASECAVQPCGGAIPLCMVDEFDIPAEIIDRKVTKMKMISPSNREVDVGKTLSETEYIGMCRREVCCLALHTLTASVWRPHAYFIFSCRHVTVL